MVIRMDPARETARQSYRDVLAYAAESANESTMNW